MEENYHKAYKEVIEILKYLPKESVNKIPKTMIETFEKKQKKDYVFNIDINKTFEEKNEENKNHPIRIKKQKFYEKLINFLKNLFHIKNK